eukprot:303017-Ditylum_brightwellii.AAC.1
MTVKRSTLRIFKGSQLERKFDYTTWPKQNTSKNTINDWSYKQVADWVKSHNDIPDDIADLLGKNE